MEIKVIETLFKNAKQLLEGMEEAGSHEEVQHIGGILRNTLEGLQDVVVHIITKQ